MIYDLLPKKLIGTPLLSLLVLVACEQSSSLSHSTSSSSGSSPDSIFHMKDCCRNKWLLTKRTSFLSQSFSQKRNLTGLFPINFEPNFLECLFRMFSICCHDSTSVFIFETQYEHILLILFSGTHIGQSILDRVKSMALYKHVIEQCDRTMI